MDLEKQVSRSTQEAQDDNAKTLAESAPSVRQPQEPPKDEFLVGWDGADDPANPTNWGFWIRCYYTFIASMFALVPTFGSALPIEVLPQMAKYFGFGHEVAILCISLFIAGYCVGPLLWGPLSENYGRRINFIVSLIGFCACNVGAALSKNTASILIFRFLGGCFGVCPLTNSGALMGDIWEPRRRGNAITVFAIIPAAGQGLAPVVSGYIQVSGTSWRWIFWLLTIWTGVCVILAVFTLPETFAPVILRNKALQKRKETGEQRWYAPIDARKITPGQLAVGILIKPWQIFFNEPMLMAIHIYLAFMYGVIYLLLPAFDIVFGKEGHNFNPGVQGAMFLSLVAGGIISLFIMVVFINPRYIKTAMALAPNPVPPEARLPIGVVGSVFFALGFFVFAWTSYPNVSYWGPVVASTMMSFGVCVNFLCLTGYIIDTYLQVAASALATNVVLRSIFGAVFPLFATQMYEKLNPRWATTLLGFIALVLMPIPAMFIRYGPTLRAKSRYSVRKN